MFWTLSYPLQAFIQEMTQGGGGKIRFYEGEGGDGAKVCVCKH